MPDNGLLAVYTHLRTFESDFDKSQSQIRALCSAWSAAVLTGIALIVINANSPPSGLSAGVAAAREDTLAFLRGMICLIGSAGVLAFWLIDQRVYQRLLHSVFGYGLHLEHQHPDLPQIRSTLFINNLDVSHRMGWFYWTQAWMFLVFACIFVWPLFGVHLGAVPPGIKALTYIHVAIVVIGSWSSRYWPTLRGLVAEFYPDLASDLPMRHPGWRDSIIVETDPAGLWTKAARRDAVKDEALRQAWMHRVRAHPKRK
uniref:Transmembrane protein n=1 Tax=Rhodopseudomonas palustris (strain BisA53) TaxID=316055 RepID=Q07SR4_RHOP5